MDDEKEKQEQLLKEYEGRFGWRPNHNLQRMAELYEMVGNTGGGETIKVYPKLEFHQTDGSQENSLSVSIFFAWCEVCECFIFGQFQSAILLCRTIAERSLKLEYIKANGELPAGERWMLGRLINECNGLVSQNVLDLARDLTTPGNDRAHALLEITDPEMAIRGGENRGISITSQSTYMIEPYKGDAVIAIEKAHLILKELHS